MSGGEMTVERAQLVLQRWENKRYYGDEYNRTLMLTSYNFRKYPLNVFILNRNALKIQHAFFEVRAGIKKIIPKRKTCNRGVSRSFAEPSRLNTAKSVGKFSNVGTKHKGRLVKDFDYHKQETDKREREQRIIEARKKYGSNSRKSVCSSTTAKSRPSTAEKYKKKVKPVLAKQPTITDNELQNVMNVAWVKAETEKQKKFKQMQRPKRAPLRSQDSINEEILVNKIVSQAYVEASTMKQNKVTVKKHPKQPVLHSKASIQEAKEVSQIVKNAWTKVDQEKKSASKIPKIKKKPLRSQESINEEKLVGQILNKAFDEAEVLRKKTQQMRKQAEKNRKKPKLHSQESIQEELAVKSIVNKAWNHVHEEPQEEKLDNICENDMEHESSFDSDSDSEAPTPKADPGAEPRRQQVIQKEVEYQSEQRHSRVEAPALEASEQYKKQRRSRANRKTSRDMTSSKSNKGHSNVLQPNLVEIVNKSPFKVADTNVSGSGRKGAVNVSNLDSDFNEEDLLISPVKENRQLLTEDYLEYNF